MAFETDPDPNEMSFARPISEMNIANGDAAKDVLAGLLEHLRNLRTLLAAHGSQDEATATIRKRIREHHARIRAHCDEHDLPLPTPE